MINENDKVFHSFFVIKIDFKISCVYAGDGTFLFLTKNEIKCRIVIKKTNFLEHAMSSKKNTSNYKLQEGFVLEKELTDTTLFAKLS